MDQSRKIVIIGAGPAGEKAAAQDFDGAPDRFQGLLAPEGARLDEHDLPASHGEVRGRGLEGHGAGETEAVLEGALFVLVRVDANAARRRPARRVVENHEACEPARGIRERDHLLEALRSHAIEKALQRLSSIPASSL